MSECFLTRVGFSQHPQQRAEVPLLIRKQVFFLYLTYAHLIKVFPASSLPPLKRFLSCVYHL